MKPRSVRLSVLALATALATSTLVACTQPGPSEKEVAATAERLAGELTTLAASETGSSAAATAAALYELRTEANAAGVSVFSLLPLFWDVSGSGHDYCIYPREPQAPQLDFASEPGRCEGRLLQYLDLADSAANDPANTPTGGPSTGPEIGPASDPSATTSTVVTP